MPTMVLSWIKYTQSRGGSWSHKRVKELLGKHGYNVQLGYPGNPEATMIANVTLSGTEKELIAHRREVTRLLHTFNRKLNTKIDILPDKENN